MDADAYPQEVLGDEEPKYLRRQKPLEIKRRKFGRKAWKTYFAAAMWTGFGLAGAWVAYEATHFLLTSSEMSLIHPEQVQIQGIHNIARESVLEIFAADRGRSVLRIHLGARRRQIEAIPWVEQATVRRALPDRIEVEILERTPIAFLREGSNVNLVDVHGVILERPLEGNFNFPVVTGIGVDMVQDEREKRMQLFAGFTEQVASARAGALEQVSEVDLSDEHDLRATITGLQPLEQSSGSGAMSNSSGAASFPPGQTGGPTQETWGQADAPVLVHFGDSDFETKYQELIENIGQWRATAGRVESVDLRFSREAVVNPDTKLASKTTAKKPLAEQSHAPKIVAQNMSRKAAQARAHD